MKRLGVLAIFLLGCSSTPGGDDSCTVGSDCAIGFRCVDQRCEAIVDGGVVDRDVGERPDVVGRGAIMGLALDPPTATLTIAPGERPTQAFELLATYEDGTTEAVSGPAFVLDELSFGDIDPASGIFTANGAAGGATLVRATAPGRSDLEATAEIIVQLEATLIGPDLPADVETRFAAPVADEARRASLVYPLDGAVLPQNAYAIDTQWLQGTAGDIYRVTLEKPHARVAAYTGDPARHWLVDLAAWEALTRSEPDADMAVTVDRFDATAGDAVAGTPVHIRFARASLAGSVYYWDIQRGRIVRIDDGTADAIDFMPSPPDSLMVGEQCVGCHTVSTSGRYMAGRLGGGENIGAVFDLTTDLSGSPPATEFPLVRGEPSSARWWFSSWSPDDTRMVVSQGEGAASGIMGFLDPFTGAQVTPSGIAPTNVTHPAWSPDGTQIAYVTNLNAWGGALTVGDIATVDVTGPDALGGSRVIHSGASLAGDSPPGAADSYPTWAPDSSLIAFSHGSGARSEDQQSALYAMARDGSNPVRLDRANGGDTTNFQPRFSPFDQGGYFWVSFLSRRDYGNEVVGTRGAGLQQIWVAAIRKDAAPGEDPSAVPYWLSGQRTTSRNISAYWAPRACREDGDSCAVGAECCGGDCRPGDDGALVCSPPPPDRCRTVGETCSTTDDCCEAGEGVVCYMRVCVRPPG